MAGAQAEGAQRKSAPTSLVPNSAEAKQLQQLKARDREVRAHEAAHKATAGTHALSGPSFTLQRGPDGRQYAIGGEVQIDLAPVAGDPEATLRKAEQVRRAALAPAQPSGPDRAVAARAGRMAAEARIEIAQEQRTRQQGVEDPANRGEVVRAPGDEPAGYPVTSRSGTELDQRLRASGGLGTTTDEGSHSLNIFA